MEYQTRSEEELEKNIEKIATRVSRWLSVAFISEDFDTSRDIVDEMQEARDHCREALVLVHEQD